jgi:hypothetical protein
MAPMKEMLRFDVLITACTWLWRLVCSFGGLAVSGV